MHEALLLLCIEDEEGTCTVDNADMAVSAGILGELVLEERLGLDPDHRVLEVASVEPTGEPVLDSILENLAAGQTHSVMDVLFLISSGQPYHLVARSLCEQGILREKKTRIFFLINHTFYPELDGRPEEDLREHLKRAVFADEGEVGALTSLLISIADRTGVLRETLGQEAIIERRQRIDEISSGEALGESARLALQAVEAEKAHHDAMMMYAVAGALTQP